MTDTDSVSLDFLVAFLFSINRSFPRLSHSFRFSISFVLRNNTRERERDVRSIEKIFLKKAYYDFVSKDIKKKKKRKWKQCRNMLLTMFVNFLSRISRRWPHTSAMTQSRLIVESAKPRALKALTLFPEISSRSLENQIFPPRVYNINVDRTR